MRHFDEQLHELYQKVVAMGLLAESMIQTAVASLIDRDESLHAGVFAKENEVNALQVEVDDRAVKLTAMHQPVAQDARFLFMASRIAGELERIADQAVNICQNAHFVLESPPLEPIVKLPAMAEVAQQMVRASLNAMTTRDIELANQTLEQEQRVDAYRDEIFHVLLHHMTADPGIIQRGLSLILIARNLERIGDHATNIAEEVIYWIQGRDVRHGKAVQG